MSNPKNVLLTRSPHSDIGPAITTLRSSNKKFKLNKISKLASLAAGITLFASSQVLADSISFSQQSYDFNEIEGTVQLSVNVMFDYGGPCTYKVPVTDNYDFGGGEIVSGSAQPGVDYTMPQTTLIITSSDAGTTQATVTLPIHLINNKTAEPLKDIQLYFGTPEYTDSACTGLNNFDPTVPQTTVNIYGNPTPASGLHLQAGPGETAQGTFTINTQSVPFDITSDLVSTERVIITPNFVDGTSTPVTISYSYDVPADAALGSVINDTITVGPPLAIGAAAAVGSTPDSVTIPVSITVTYGSATLQSVRDAWTQLCQNNPQLEACTRFGTSIDDTLAKELSPEEMAAMGTGAINMTQGQFKSVFYQQRARRHGAKGTDLNRLTLMLDGQAVPIGQLAGTYLENATGGGAGDVPPNRGRWSVFASGRINNGDKQATGIDSGYNYDTTGLTAGADYMLSDTMFLGAALGYAGMKSDFGNNGGNLDIKSGNLILYGSYFTPKNWYADLSLIYGRNNYDFTRNLPSFSTHTDGSTNGNQLSFSLGSGVDWYVSSWDWSPYVRVDYVDTSIDAYEETGGGGVALQVDEQKIKSLTTALGGRVSYALSQSWGVLSPTAHLEWLHEYKDNQRQIVARFSVDPSVSFATPVDQPDSDYLNYGLGLTANFPAGRVLYINFEGVAAQQNFSDYNLHIGGRMDF